MGTFYIICHAAYLLLLSSSQLSIFRRLSFSRSKQANDRDHTPAEGTLSGDVGIRGEPPSPAAAGGSSDLGMNRSGLQQKSLPSGARGPRSGACAVL